MKKIPEFSTDKVKKENGKLPDWIKKFDIKSVMPLLELLNKGKTNGIVDNKKPNFYPSNV